MSDPILGKVAAVTSDRELIINRGAVDGVTVGMTFFVKDLPVEVTDPDTKEKLGEITPVKVVVRVEEVSERFSIARTYRSKKVQISEGQKASPLYGLMRGGALAGALQPPVPPKFETRIETLRHDPAQGEPIHEYDSVVSVGDVVEQSTDSDSSPATTTLFRAVD
jgi:hypothetical protein